MRKEAEERRIKEEEERKIREHKERVDATLKSLTEAVPLLDEGMFLGVGALLDQTEDYPKNMIMVGALTVEQAPAKELEEQKAELQSNRKATFISTLKKQVHTQMMLQNLTQQDYLLKLQEIKELEENQAIDWSSYAQKINLIPAFSNIELPKAEERFLSPLRLVPPRIPAKSN